MPKCLITMRSSTYAMKGRRALYEKGIPAETVKLDSELTGRGCTHGIRIDCRNKVAAEVILRENGVFYSDIIRR